MGFWDQLGEAAGKKIAEAQKNYDGASERASRLSDRQLYESFKREQSIVRKKAYADEWKRRHPQEEE